MKLRTILLLGGAMVLLSATVFAAPVAYSAPLKQAVDGSGGPISNSAQIMQTSAEVAAYWTAAAMAAAKPMDITLPASERGTAPAPGSVQTQGTPGFVNGNAPGQPAASPQIGLVSSTVSPANANVYQWYGYPFPYNVSYVGWLWPSWYPFITNGKVFFTQNGGNYVCSGTSVTSGTGGNSRVITTAGHCVHAGNGLASGWSYNVLFCPGYNAGVGSYGCWSYVQLWTQAAWYYNYDFRYDQGIILSANTNTSGSYGRINSTVGSQGASWNQGYVQQWWEFGYPAAAPYDGSLQVMTSASTAAYDNTQGNGYPYPVGTGSNETGGSSGGGWIQWARLGNYGYYNGHNDFKWSDQPAAMYSPYIETGWYNLWNAARVSFP